MKKQLSIEITCFKGRMILVYLTKAFSPMNFDKYVKIRGLCEANIFILFDKYISK